MYFFFWELRVFFLINLGEKKIIILWEKMLNYENKAQIIEKKTQIYENVFMFTSFSLLNWLFFLW